VLEQRRNKWKALMRVQVIVNGNVQVDERLNPENKSLWAMLSETVCSSGHVIKLKQVVRDGRWLVYSWDNNTVRVSPI